MPEKKEKRNQKRGGNQKSGHQDQKEGNTPKMKPRRNPETDQSSRKRDQNERNEDQVASMVGMEATHQAGDEIYAVCIVVIVHLHLAGDTFLLAGL